MPWHISGFHNGFTCYCPENTDIQRCSGRYDGEPIIGASVKVVGTTTGTITDLDGKFMVVVPSGKQVEISYIGYITQVLSDFKQTKIELKEDTQQLDEVVVVGYGTQKKRI